MNIKLCKNCNNEFMSKWNTQYCSEKCKQNKLKQEKILKQEKLFENKIENMDYVICKLCNKKLKCLFGGHLTNEHNMTSKQYKNMFPDAKVWCQTLADNTIVCGGGLHMKEEKWRKWASDKMKGENNINHKSKTTEQERKERSPFSKEWYKKRNLTEKDRSNFIEEAIKDREYWYSYEYWSKRGFSREETYQIFKKHLFSLENCIRKYGEIDGYRIWKERQDKWKEKVFNETTHISKGTSKEAEKIIEEIILYNKDSINLLYGKNEKFIYDNENKRVYKYDLTNPLNKRIIEINGIFWHCKPELYEENYMHPVKKITAKEIWKFDKDKLNTAINHGYKILLIWEDNYIKNPEDTIKKCVNFIYENIN